MRKKVLLLAMCLGLVAGVSHATISVRGNGGPENSLKSITVDVDNLSATEIGWGKKIDVAGSITDGSGDFTFAWTAASDWDTSAAQAAIDAGTFESYLAGLTPTTMNASQGRVGVNGAAGDDNSALVDSSGEVLVLTFDTDNLVNKLAFQGCEWDSLDAGDKMDFLVYDSSANVIVQADYDIYPRDVFDPGDPNSPTFNRVVETGDTIVLAWRGGSWRPARMYYFDVDKLNLAAHSPVPAGPEKVITVEPGTITLSWYSPEQLDSGVFVDDPNYVVDQYDVYVIVNPEGDPNFVDVSPVQSSLDQTYDLSGLFDADVVYWRVDTTVTADSTSILDPVTQIFEGDVWSFTASANPAPESVDAGPDYVTWPGADVPIAGTVTDAGAENVTVTFTSTDPCMTFSPNPYIIEDSDVVKKDDLAFMTTATTISDNGDPGDVVVTVTASDSQGSAESTMTITVYSNSCRATRLTGKTERYATDLVLGDDIGTGCKIDLYDFARFVEDWLKDYAEPAAFENPVQSIVVEE